MSENSKTFSEKRGYFAALLSVNYAIRLGAMLIALSSHAQTPNFRWVQQAQQSALFSTSEVNCMTVDNAGNCFVVGQFWQSTNDVVFIGSTVTNTFSEGAYVAKYDRYGNLLWVRQPLGGVASGIFLATSAGRGVIADASGNCYITGSFATYTNTFAGITLSNSSSMSTGFIIKYDPNGNALWAAQPNSGSGLIYRAGLDTNGNLYVAGAFDSATIQFGGTILTNSGQPDEYDFFLVKYDVSGNVLWATAGGPCELAGMRTDGAGNCYLTAASTGTAGFGSIVPTNGDLYLAKYDNNGNALWAQSAVGASPLDIAVDVSGNSYLTGYLSATDARFGTNVLANSNTQGGYPPFVAKYDAQGNALWAVAPQVTGSNYDVGSAITVDGAGNCYFTGSLESSALTFSPATALTNNDGPHSEAGYVAKYDTTGNFLWAKKFGGNYYDPGLAIASDKWGTLYLAGLFTSTNAMFDSLALTNSNSPANTTGIFVAQIAGPQLSIQPLGNQLTISWPTNTIGLGLESASGLGGGGWSSVTNAPVVVGNQYVVTNSITGGSVFYRLNLP